MEKRGGGSKFNRPDPARVFVVRVLFVALVVWLVSVLTSKAQDTAGIPAGPLTVSVAARELIVEYEVGGKGYYQKCLQTPEWPGGPSGVTVGIGYDLGYETAETVAADWAALGGQKVAALQSVRGLTGQRARLALARVKWVVVPWETAIAVFDKRSLPQYGRQTAGAFPAAPSQHPHCQGVLESLVYNRGPGMAGDSRREMRAIRDCLPAEPWRVPGLLRAMKRLWVGKGLDGLLTRRDAEAALYARGLQFTGQGVVLGVPP